MRITAPRIQGGELQYQADWDEPDGPDYNFYAAFNFRGVSPLLQAFHDENPGQAGPPVRLQKWLEADSKMKVAREHGDDDKAQFAAKLEWHARIQIDATDPYLNYERRRFEEVVSILIHEMAHAFLYAYVCGCTNCTVTNHSTDRLCGQTSHGHVFRRLIAGMEAAIRFWSPALQAFTVINSEAERDPTEAEILLRARQWSLVQKATAQNQS